MGASAQLRAAAARRARSPRAHARHAAPTAARARDRSGSWRRIAPRARREDERALRVAPRLLARFDRRGAAPHGREPPTGVARRRARAHGAGPPARRRAPRCVHGSGCCEQSGTRREGRCLVMKGTGLNLTRHQVLSRVFDERGVDLGTLPPLPKDLLRYFDSVRPYYADSNGLLPYLEGDPRCRIKQDAFEIGGLVFGASGLGKSYLIHVLVEELRKAWDIHVIDAKGETFARSEERRVGKE